MDIVEYFLSKINENEEFIRITFYELRVKNNLSEEETNQILEQGRDFLEGRNYLVYFTDDNYYYKNSKTVVQTNELMIAIKRKEY